MVKMGAGSNHINPMTPYTPSIFFGGSKPNLKNSIGIK